MSPQRLAFLYQNLNFAKDSVPTFCTSSDTLLLTQSGYEHTTERACSGEARCLQLCMHIVVAGEAAHFRARPGVVHIPAQTPGSIAFIVRNARELGAFVSEAVRQQTGHALDHREARLVRGCNLVDFESTAADRAMCA